MKRACILGLAVVVASAVSTVVGGQKSQSLDRDFLIQAASANHAEIAINQLAYKKAVSTPVKDFADMLVKDHQSAYDQLAELLKNRKLGVVTGLEKNTKDTLDRLGKLEGKDFDREYLQCMIREHKNAVALFEGQANNGKEADIREYAKRLLPSLQKHLKKAQELNKKVGQ